MSTTMLHTFLLFLATFVVAQPHGDGHTNPVHSANYKQTIFLPFTSQFSSSSIPSVRGEIHGKPFTFPVSTGSTGLMIGAPLLPFVDLSGANENHYQRGWEFMYDSSLLYTGRFVPLSVTFFGEDGQRAVSQVPVLVVQQIVKCPSYNVERGNGVCPMGKSVPTHADPRRVTYMGVGFGRNIAGSGVPLGISLINPFLNIVSINGHHTDNLVTGYRVSTRGVDLGLTDSNTRGAAWTDLDKGLSHDPRDWAEVDVSFKIDGHGDFRGKACIDTSIPQMVIQSAPIASLPSVNIHNPNAPPEYVPRVKPGTHLEFTFPGFQDAIAGYGFGIGDMMFPSQPEYVLPVTDGPGPFVNTGRNFLYGFNVLFDAVEGRFGLVCLKCKGEQGYFQKAERSG